MSPRHVAAMVNEADEGEMREFCDALSYDAVERIAKRFLPFHGEIWARVFSHDLIAEYIGATLPGEAVEDLPKLRAIRDVIVELVEAAEAKAKEGSNA